MTRAGGVRLPLFPSVTLDCCQYVRAPVGSGEWEQLILWQLSLPLRRDVNTLRIGFCFPMVHMVQLFDTEMIHSGGNAPLVRLASKEGSRNFESFRIFWKSIGKFYGDSLVTFDNEVISLWIIDNSGTRNPHTSLHSTSVNRLVQFPT